MGQGSNRRAAWSTPFRIWLVTLGLTIAVHIFRPDFRIATIILFTLHAIVLIWSTFDIHIQFFCRVLYKAPATDRRIALTFDDGPDPRLTPRILDILASHRIKATFFVVGSQAALHPEIVRRASAEGHTIACHDYSHSYLLNFRLRSRAEHEIRAAQEIIERIIGRKPLLYRPPSGLMNPEIALVLGRLSMRCIGWSRRVRDAANRRARRIGHIPQLAGPGEVVLLHDVLPRPEHLGIVVDAVTALCENIRTQGLVCVGVEDLFSIPAYEEAPSLRAGLTTL